MNKADAIVIGGGVIGLSIAYRLAENRKVILIEKGEIGGQTSTSCDKAIFLQSKQPGFPITLAKASREIYENLETELGQSIEFKRAGGMIVIESESHLPFMKDFVEKQNQAGIHVRMLSREEALERQPSFSKHIVGSTYSSEDAEVNPLLLGQAFARAAERKGVEILTQTKVIDIKVKKGKVVGVQTDRGYIATELVINAAGPFAQEIGLMVGLDLPIKPRRGMILVSEKVSQVVNGSVLCSQYVAAKHLTQTAKEAAPPFGIGLALGQLASGNLLIGGSREFVGFNKMADQAVMSAIAKHASRIVPALADVRIIRTMVGFRPFTGDGLPIIDKVPGIEGLIIAAGHEGDGIALAPITGKLVASLVAGEENELLAPLKLSRFNKKT